MAVTRAPVAGSEQLQSIDLESLRDGGYLDMPIVEAAQELGMSLSALKGLAHEQGIQRWPYRSRQSIRALIEQTVQHIKGGSLGLHGAREEEALLEALQGDLEDVGAGRTPCLSSAIKRYRQWMFKLKHNRKKSPGSRMVVPRRVIAAFSR
ncbi:hypothetical protein WJX72_001121 [[Myrmecia] bisecta]|uniref:RWP-RK domain-containing protein n=1 Tax=[Myrmecia] bisecta TaxID=41462 RepID=A0AAW1QP53_9CHLO